MIKLKSYGKKKDITINKIKKIGEGAESIIYSANFFGINSIIKDRIVKTYREKELDIFLRYQRTKKEAKILAISSTLINAPKVVFINKYKIIMQKIEGENFNNILKEIKENTRSNKKINLRLILNRVGKSLAILHNNVIIHGDFTPANLIINNNKVFVIDFGLSEMSSLNEDKAIDLLLMKRAIEIKKYNIFLNAYKKYANNAISIINRLKKIEKRGRYKERTLITID